jgi:hypothetical protein
MFRLLVFESTGGDALNTPLSVSESEEVTFYVNMLCPVSLMS